MRTQCDTCMIEAIHYDDIVLSQLILAQKNVNHEHETAESSNMHTFITVAIHLIQH